MARPITRRLFLRNASLAIAGAAAAPAALAQMRGGGGGMGGGGMGGGSAVIDPPVSGPFVEPPLIGTRSGDVLEVAFDAAATRVTVNGVAATLLTYGGRFVAPTIRARRGDLVRIRFRNLLPTDGARTLVGHDKYSTNLHVHGWHVSPGYVNDVPADNVHIVIPPSRPSRAPTQLYEYDLSKQREGSLGLYHPHVHGSVAEQFWGGLVGALDIEDDPAAGLAPYRCCIAVLKDITIANGAPAPYTMMSDYMQGKEGSLCTVNGRVNPLLEVEPGEVFRLRFINASNARFYRLQLQSHAMSVLGVDGGHLGAPFPVQDLLVAPGERADLLFQAPAVPGDYKLLSLPYARMGMMTSPQITLMTVRVGSGSTRPRTLPVPASDFVPPQRLDAGSGLVRRSFALSMGMGRGYINGQSFELLADGSTRSVEVHSTVETDEIWEIVNQSNMDHPWHQHVNDAQLISAAGGDASFARYAQLLTAAPAWKDTIIVPKMGSVTLRVPIRDHTGMTMFHCHILEHEDIGMMGMWHIMEDMPMGGMSTSGATR